MKERQQFHFPMKKNSKRFEMKSFNYHAGNAIKPSKSITLLSSYSMQIRVGMHLSAIDHQEEK
jgi:hypothetical protein